MKHFRRHPLAVATALAVMAMMKHTPALAEPQQVPGPTANAHRLVEGKRLSGALLENPPGNDDFVAGISWQVDAQKKVQAAERSALLLYMVNAPIAGRGHVPASDPFMQWLEALPITGRVPIPSADARWLQVHPESDPLIDPADRIVVPPRPIHVVVLTAKGERCVMPHLPGFTAVDYIRACAPAQETAGPIAYITQPDGRVARVPISIWNQKPQVEPGPGAYIFAPATDSGWTPTLASRLMAFIGTQGPAPNEVVAEPGAIDVASLPGKPRSTSSVPINSSDWGVVGLLQTPTARMAETGNISATFSRVSPYSRFTFMFQPLPWLEAGFRYSTLSNQLYGVVAGSNQPYADKSVDVKVGLTQESQWIPATAVGLRDIGGTGLFSGEYVVASKRWGSIDASVGLGWGQLGERGDLPNPLSIFGSQFSTRPADANSGQFSLSSYFHGRTAAFGGVTWQTPYDPLSVKVEYDGNNYKHEPFNTVLPDRSPFNFAAVYKASPNVDVTVGLERGNTAVFSVSFHAGLNELSTPKFADPKPVPIGPTRPFYVDKGAIDAATPNDQVSTPTPAVTPSAASSRAIVPTTSAPLVLTTVPAAVLNTPGSQQAVRATDPPRSAVVAVSPVDWAKTARDIQAQTGWRVAEIRPDGRDLRVVFANPSSIYWRGLIDRVLAVLHRDAPSEFDRFRLVFTVRGVQMTEYLVFRDYWVEEQTSYQAPQDKRQSVVIMTPHAPSAALPVYASQASLFSGGFGPSYSQSAGGPDNLLLYQIGIEGSGAFNVTDHIWAYGALNYRLIDNYAGFNYDAPSDLPRVRTDIRHYLEDARLTMPNLQLTALDQFGPDQFYTVYGGYLETMFAGVGGEYLYRPQGSQFAFGVNVNEVRQRGFKENFSLLPYHVATGFASLYWETGWHQVTAELDVGQYLAGDKGATLSLSREFNNGVVVGAYATKTNISAATYGEGSFDKGIFLAIPFDALLGRTTGYVAPLRYVPVLRDGGQMLNRAYPLYGLTGTKDPRLLNISPPSANGATGDEPDQTGN